MTGKLRNIRDDKFYAFLVSGVNRDIFLHKQQYIGDWDELRELWRKTPNVTLEFEIHETEKGLRAMRARLV